MAKSPSSHPTQGRTPPNAQGAQEPADPARNRTDIALEIERQIGPLVQSSTRDQVVSRVLSIVSQEVFNGPLPHPKHFRAYKDICPGAADRILAMAEKSLDHNINVNATSQRDEVADRKLGMILGFLALLALIVGAIVCAVLHLEMLAAAFLGAGALGLVGKFIVGRKLSAGSDKID